MPSNELGCVNENGVNIIDSREDIFFGTTVTMQISPQPGHYVAICNLPEHYEAGMQTEFMVEGAANAGESGQATAEPTGETTKWQSS